MPVFGEQFEAESVWGNTSGNAREPAAALSARPAGWVAFPFRNAWARPAGGKAGVKVGALRFEAIGTTISTYPRFCGT
jgi:hypothetical protein